MLVLKLKSALKRLLRPIHLAKIYLHTMSGELFGISTVEAMSVGLILVVPAVGGHTEFVPNKYQFRTLEEASEIISSAMNVPYSERNKM